MDYNDFLIKKSQLGGNYGFDAKHLPSFLFDFQKHIVNWSTRKGRSAIFADCGLGKTAMQLVWAQNIVEKTNKPVLIATPLAVSYQTLKESEKFSIEAIRSSNGKYKGKIVITNYERLEHFDSSQFAGMICDESSILKNFNGTRKQQITDFMRKMPYRLLCTATAAPNDFIELGTSSEALGEMGYTDMLGKFFKNEQSTISPQRNWGEAGSWRLKKHAHRDFWRWVASWSLPCRKPSDLGYSDNGYNLPKLIQSDHLIKAQRTRPGLLFDMPAVGLKEEREDKRRTILERCEKAADMSLAHKKSILWCHLNQESDTLEEMIPGAKQVKGGMKDEQKEEILMAFAEGDLPYLITKPKIGAFGLNLQRCSHMCYFPSHSYEQYYQAVRRCWRFGQKNNVIVDRILTDGQVNIMHNLERKASQANRMFDELIKEVNNPLNIDKSDFKTQKVTIPTWN